jgi:hypothetical protein
MLVLANSYAQNCTLNEFLRKNIAESMINPSDTVRKLARKNPNEVLIALNQLQSDSDKYIRRNTAQCIYELSCYRFNFNTPDLRQKGLILLLNQFDDKVIKQSYLPNALQYYDVEDFNDSSKNIIRQLLSEQYPFASVVLVAGMLNLSDQKENIKRYQQGGIHNSYRKDEDENMVHASHLALARMGDTTEIRYVITPTAEMIKYSYSLFTNFASDLAYIRKPEGLNKLIELLYSEDTYINENYTRKMNTLLGNQFARMLDDFIYPFSDNFPYNNDEIKNVKEWLNQNKGKYVFNSSRL